MVKVNGDKENRNAVESDKEPILLVFNYGAAIKNFIFNETLWDYLTKKYYVDVISDTYIENYPKIGIRKFFKFDMNISYLKKLLRKIDYYIISRVFIIHYASLLLETGFGFLYGEIHRTWLRKEREKSQYLFWGAIGKTRLFRTLKSFIDAFPKFIHLWCPFLREEDYKFILIANFIASPGYFLARYGNKRKIPVFASIMGIDNVSTGGPFMATPDILFLWGNEQLNEFGQIQKKYNANFANSKVMLTGNLIFDTYLCLSREINCRNELKVRFGVPDNYELILFPAYVEYLWPKQNLLCKKILKFISENNLPVKLLVRVRPGFDEDMWKKLQEETKGEIIIQIPRGSAYDKSSKMSSLVPDEAFEDIKEFIIVFKSASLLILPSFSSTVVDASLFGVPSFVAAFGYGGYTTPLDEYRYFNMLKIFYPHRADYHVFFEEKELFDALDSFFIKNRRENFKASRRLFEEISFSDDAGAGKRYIEAIESYFGNQSL